MFTTAIQPRFGDMDFLGHINNTVLALWFETARNSVFRIFSPDLIINPEIFPLIMAHTEYDFIDELYYQYDVEIRTWVSKIGTKSFTVYQEAWQKGTERPLTMCVKGKSVMVHYNFRTRRSTPLPEDKKKLLGEHLLVSGK